MRPFRRALIVIGASVAIALVGVGPATAASEDVTIGSADGTQLAATLSLPDGVAPPGGWPAVVVMHGLGGDRSTMTPVVSMLGIADRYAVLTYDARGHGASGGSVGIDGPGEVADARAVFGWLRDRPDVSDTKIGVWGISYGGGAALNSLAAGVPWAAVEAVQTWSNLRTALVPQDLTKTGVVAGFLSGLNPERVDPEVLTIRDAAFKGSIGQIIPWAEARSSIGKLRGVTTPVFLMQGRRDFAFGLDQARAAYAALAGPKRLWLGLHGHAPSTFPAPDSPAMLAEGAKWFDRYLRGVQGGLDLARPIAISPESWKGAPSRFAKLPGTRTVAVTLGGTGAIATDGRVQRRTTPLASGVEVFGAPIVKVTATAARGWARLVAVLSARTPAGKEIVVAGGGIPTVSGKRTYTIHLNDQATYLPRGSRLTLTLAASSLAQNPSNLLYLALPMPAGARLTIGAASMRLPTLVSAVTR